MPQNDVENRYSLMVGLVFIFNIIVGTGALTLPAAFAKAGWALGSISIIFLAFVSYINATYVIECMACANAVLKWKRSDLTSDSAVLIQDAVETDESIDENTPMNRPEANRNLANMGEGHILSVATSHYYSLDTRVELGEMATLFFNSLGKIAFYITIIVYLFGDLSIYSAAIAKSTMDVICAHGSDNNTNISLPDDRPCFNSTDGEAGVFTRLECYRIILIVFLTLLGPFVFFNVQKTKYLQIITSVMRWLGNILLLL